MQVLTFQIGDDRLALDIRRVCEVAPRVNLRRTPGSPDWLAGVFIFRGDVVPVVDLHRLASAPPCPPHLSSRIILVTPRRGAEESRLVGLLASRVDDTRDFTPRGRALPGRSGDVDLGPLYATDNGTLRLFDPDHFLPETAWRALLDAAAESGA
jgi:chemotaxis-related protein WspB